MKKIQLISILLVSALCVNAKEIVLKPGQLPGEMSSIIAEGESSLVLKGTATPFDLTALRSLPNSVTSLDMSQLTIKGSDAVNGDWFGKRHYEDGEIPAYMLLSTNVSTLALPAYVSSIGAGAFSGTPLTEISVSGVKNVEEGAFHDCKKLRKAEFSDATFKTVPDRLFSGCVSLEEVQLPYVVTSVGSRAFEKCNVKSVFIPNVFSIGD
ncbi:MAG: leucine-rich repeat domain-containing protein, partial [Muribaculaceae bacterium]|nr:leucine-rich repeat domain-containing protein [Muribaculaceae bacterium]